MKIMGIDTKGAAFFCKEGTMVGITELDKEDVLSLLELVIKNDVTLDKCDENHPINNPIEKAIYVELYDALLDLACNKAIYQEEIDIAFNEALEKYCS